MAKPKILIDCDPGHDDAVALLFAARHLDLVGVTTVHGNNGLENTTRNALAVIELGGIEAPLARGCAEPLAMPNAGTAEVHGSTGLDGVTLPEPSRRPIDTHAVDFIIEMASRHRGELVLATIGPQTNIALALRREPRLKDWLAEIAVMGGSTGNGNVTAAAEWNIHCDPEAAWAVLTSGIPIRMVGLNITRVTGLDQDDIDRLRGSGRRVAGVIANLLAFYLANQRKRSGITIAPMHDVCAVIPYAYSGLIDYVHAHVEIELRGEHTRGMTLCDLRPSALAAGPKRIPPPNVQIAVEARSRDIVERVIETLLSYP
ncbi:MAG: nucleoside hydrolase [Hyphomicrobiaceae bacterium]